MLVTKRFFRIIETTVSHAPKELPEKKGKLPGGVLQMTLGALAPSPARGSASRNRLVSLSLGWRLDSIIQRNSKRIICKCPPVLAAILHAVFDTPLIHAHHHRLNPALGSRD